VAFAALVALLPASLAAPDDICLVDFRAMVVLLALSVAAIDPRRSRRRAPAGPSRRVPVW
jgi:hypothetical protein